MKMMMKMMDKDGDDDGWWWWMKMMLMKKTEVQEIFCVCGWLFLLLFFFFLISNLGDDSYVPEPHRHFTRDFTNLICTNALEGERHFWGISAKKLFVIISFSVFRDEEKTGCQITQATISFPRGSWVISDTWLSSLMMLMLRSGSRNVNEEIS